eukprot:6175496-Pleurochrysis_carterae.AAC.1
MVFAGEGETKQRVEMEMKAPFSHRLNGLLARGGKIDQYSEKGVKEDEEQGHFSRASSTSRSRLNLSSAHDVIQLDVAVDEAALVHVVDGREDLLGKLRRRRLLEAARRLAQLLDQVAARAKLHDYVHCVALGLKRLIDPHNVGVVQRPLNRALLHAHSSRETKKNRGAACRRYLKLWPAPQILPRRIGQWRKGGPPQSTVSSPKPTPNPPTNCACKLGEQYAYLAHLLKHLFVLGKHRLQSKNVICSSLPNSTT